MNAARPVRRRPSSRRRLPTRVYVVRRVLVAVVLGGLALGLVTVLSHLLQWAGTGETANPGAVTVGTTPTPTADLQDLVGSAGVSPTPTLNTRLVPTAACDPAGVTLTPSVTRAHAGGPVTVDLTVSSTTQACTFKVDADSVFVRINIFGQTLWSTQQCPGALPTATVAVRPRRPGHVAFTWSGRASDDGCTVATDWALPGAYRVYAAPRGAVDSQITAFLLQAPRRPIVYKTESPSPTPTATGEGAGKAPSDAPSDDVVPSANPSPTR